MSEFTFKQLEYAVALAERLHFGRAAEACFITQPALSEQIQLLEESLGARLFDRTRRSVRLTPSGEVFLEHARRVIDAARDLNDAMRGASKPFAAPLHLGVIPTIAPYLLPKILKRVRRAIPELSLFLREDQTHVLLERLKTGQLDMALLSFTFDVSPYEARALYREDFLFVAPDGHPVFKKNRLKESDLSDEAILLLEEGHCLSAQALDVCRMAGAQANTEFRASSLFTLTQMVANGIGVTLLPRLAADVDVKRSSGLRAAPFDEPAPSRIVGLVWRKSAARREEYEHLTRVIRKSLPDSVEVM